MSDLERRFHETWLGMVQPIDGLVVSIPVLIEAQCMERQPGSVQDRLLGLTRPLQGLGEGERRFQIGDLGYFLQEMLGHAPEAFDRGEALPEELSLYVPEGRQVIRPTLGLRKISGSGSGTGSGSGRADETPSSRAGAAYEMLVWQVPTGLPLDAPEEVTGPWRYPPSAKFDRLLRHTRVPIGLLTNDEEIRLVYAPHGESSGAITFRLDDMASVGGRPILDAFVMLLSANRFFGVEEKRSLPAILAESRKRQANVTNDLADQVFEALQILLRGFEAAAERDGRDLLDDALAREGDHLYKGLLTVLLRLVFVLYAEDRGLLPSEHRIYAEHYSVLSLFDRLQRDRDAWPDSMARRFGAWGRLVALFRAVFHGVDHGDLHMPPRRGELFDPHRFPFLEGWGPSGSAPIDDVLAQSAVRVPTVDDETVFRVLEKLLMFEGQRLSYRALDVEQIGSVYEGLMGFHVVRVADDAVCMKPDRVWVTAGEVEAVAAAQRVKWFKDVVGLAGGQAEKVVEALSGGGGGAEAGKRGGKKKRGGKDVVDVYDDVYDDVRKDPTRGADGAAGAAGKKKRGNTVVDVHDNVYVDEQKQTRSGRPVVNVNVNVDVNERASVLDVLAKFAAGGRNADPTRQRAKKDQLVLQPGQERRRTSSHYTPRSLSAPIVRRTLEPLLAVMGEAPPSERILNLKVCDPAMGSGAFLVEACRFLADHVIAAWTREGAIEGISRDHGDPVLHARRLVAQRCLYGVDKNDAAVELAKLSLWLVTLARDLPFTFVDHALRHGDSLVGLDFDQIRSFHWKPTQQLELFTRAVDEALGEAIALRQRILDLAPSKRVEDQREKERLLWDAQDALDRVRLIADVCVGAFFAGQKEKEREKERLRRLGVVNAWLKGDGGEEAAEARRELEAMRAELRGRVPAFHWHVEFPEVFYAERPDPLDHDEINRAAYMDGFVGNPPFLGGTMISSNLGDAYLSWLLSAGHRLNGKADLAAFVLRRACGLIGRHGAVGFIMTNTISQGDTRDAGLAPLIADLWRIVWAERSREWPGNAGVTVSQVVIANGRIAGALAGSVLDGINVSHIDSYLSAGSERPALVRLEANSSLASLGASIKGEGFLLSKEEANAFVASDVRNLERLAPYLGGEDVNRDPAQRPSRIAIHFDDLSLDQAAQWPALLKLVEQRVKPQRMALRQDAPAGRQRSANWWRYGGSAAEIHSLVRSLRRCLVSARVTKHLCFSYGNPDYIFSEKVVVIGLASGTAIATLQSRIHTAFAWQTCSTMREDLNYSTRDCFETFPFPHPDPRTLIPALESIGERLYTARAAYMVDNDVGLTITYNRLKDPACDEPRILELRALHEEMDRAVLDAYGWSDVAVPPYCPLDEEAKKAVERFEAEVIDRLFALNAKRAEEERLRGGGGAAKKAGTPAPRATERSEDDAPAAAHGPKKRGKKGDGDAGPGLPGVN